jgi:protein-S-isoprenylcysteine O-methyltransferase Ste14
MISIILILFAFALIHSVTVAHWFKKLCARLTGETFMRAWYRLLYTLVSVVTAGAAVWLISRVPDRHLWTAPPVLLWPLRGVQAGGILFGAMAFRHLDGMEFLGLRQAWRYIARREVSGNLEGMAERGLVTEGVYGIVRHPLYVAGIVIVTFSPVITGNGLVVRGLADLYFLFGMLIEERRFLDFFGDDYRQYMRQVPRMFPRIRPRRPPS